MIKEINEFLNEQRTFNKAANTLEGYQRTLKTFNALTCKSINDINNKDIIAYISAPSKSMGRKRQNGGLKLSTKKVELNRLHKFFAWAVDVKYIESNPVTRIRTEIGKTKVKKEITNILSVNQVSKLVKMCFNPHERIILILLYKTGMREGELRNIDIGDINHKDQSIKITDKPGNKTGERILYLDAEGWKELQDWLNVRPSTSDKALIITQRKTRISNLHIWQIVKKYGNLAYNKYGESVYQDLYPHIFRHCFTSHLADKRILVRALQILRGDSDKSMVDLYSHLSNEKIREEYLAAIPRIL